MRHRALVAYLRPDWSYNCHFSHGGARNLRLKHAITPATPFGGDGTAIYAHCHMLRNLMAASDAEAVSASVADVHRPVRQVDHQPIAVAVSTDTILTEYLDYRHHAAFYLVDRGFHVTAYRTHWLGLAEVCESVTESPTVGHGVLRTVRWVDGEPVGDADARGAFRALKEFVGELVDEGVFSPAAGRSYMIETLREWVDARQELVVRTAECST